MKSSFEVWANRHPETAETKWSFWADCATKEFAERIAFWLRDVHSCETRILHTMRHPGQPGLSDPEMPAQASPVKPVQPPTPTFRQVADFLGKLVVIDGKLVHVDIGGKLYSVEDFAAIFFTEHG